MVKGLLETKFHIPSGRADGVARPRLIELLEKGLSAKHKLILISAPAGYGKTTLLGAWLHSLKDDVTCAWLSLDEEDNEHNRFLGYWVSAFSRADESLGREVRPLLEMGQLPSPAAVVDALINDLTELQRPVIVALDDYHVINNPQIHEVLARFVERLPENVHLVISARQDPPFPLARMRAHAQMTEIRAQNLRFTREETNQFLRSMKLDLPEEVATMLEERTEGWAVGLQLAGLALQNPNDLRRFIETFHGSHRYVLDYLAEEVIRQQGDEIRAFLAQTSVLDRFNAEVCSALTGQTNSQVIIDRLERSNLFIVPLDDRRRWYRYHHLFADYLRSELSKAEQKALLEKASRWHEANGLVFEAVKYAFLSENSALAADVLEGALQNASTWSGGELGTLIQWLDKLPRPLMSSRPMLTLHASRALYLAGRVELSIQFLDQAEDALRKNPASASDVERQLAIVSTYRASLAAFHGDLQAAFELARRALDQLPQDEWHARARATDALGLAHELSGNLEEASRAFLRASELARTAGVSYLAVNALCEAALAQIGQGRLSQAAQFCRQAMQLDDNASIPPLGLTWAILAEIAREQNDLAAAERYLMDGMKLSQQGGLTDDLRYELLFLARLRQSQGDVVAARAAAGQAEAITQTFGIRRLSNISGAQQARIHLMQGTSGWADQWALGYVKFRELEKVEYVQDFEELTLARVYLSNREFEKASSLLDPLLDKAVAAGRNRAALEAALLLALLHQAQNQTDPAVEWLEKALKQAEPEGFLRIFLDEGSWLEKLLPGARHAAPDLADRLMQIFSERAGNANQGRSHSFNEKLIAPLSEQELRVLRLVAAGKSNAQIAAELVISVGTAKWHVHNILQKLDVGTRAQAIARARELGI